MPKRTQGGPKRSKAPEAPPGRQPRPEIVHSSVYLHRAVYEVLREAAFKERVKIHDIVLEGIGAALKRRGYPSLEEFMSGKKR